MGATYPPNSHFFPGKFFLMAVAKPVSVDSPNRTVTGAGREDMLRKIKLSNEG
jgi:hypothetical protein